MVHRTFCGIAVLILGASLLTADASTAKKPRKSIKKPTAEAVPEKVRVAEGKYELRRTDGQPLRAFEEPWTLYKTRLGYELEEQWHVGATDQAPEAVIDVRVNFAGGMNPIDVRIGGDDAQRQLLCQIALKEFTCASAGLEAKLEMDGNYNFFSPSPWMLGAIARRGKKVPGSVTPVQLVRMGGMTETGPRLAKFEADVSYVGDDEVDVAGVKHQTSIFELKAEGKIPTMLLWVSSDGIVLQIQDASRPEQRMDMVELTKYGKF